MQHRIKAGQLVNVDGGLFAGQLGEEEFGEWQLDEQILVDRFAEDASDEVVVFLEVGHDHAYGRIRVELVIGGDPGNGML